MGVAAEIARYCSTMGSRDGTTLTVLIGAAGIAQCCCSVRGSRDGMGLLLLQCKSSSDGTVLLVQHCKWRLRWHCSAKGSRDGTATVLIGGTARVALCCYYSEDSRSDGIVLL